MSKSPDAFRTISEVSEVLGTPAHVLRFWESKFSQIKPVKRAGGRRYYRPQDISLLAGIKHLLHEQGMTIKGAQKLLREKGVKHVAGLIDAPQAADAAVTEDVPAPQAAATDSAADNVIGFNAMPPPTPAPDAAPVAKATAPTNDAPAQADKPVSAQDELPLDVDAATGPRFFDAMIAADSDLLRARAAEIVPLMDRLREIKGRLETR